MRNYKDDLVFGLKTESEVLYYIQCFFLSYEIEKTTNRFAQFDFKDENDELFFELKSRRFEKNKYTTTIIPSSKIKNIKDNTNVYFIFNFTDSLSYIKYDKELFDKFERQIIKIYRKNIYDKPTEHIYIPIDSLKDYNITQVKKYYNE